MKISLNQLKNYVEINVPVEEMCERMVLAGFEVESIESAGENLVNVVAAKIVSLAPHENSDHLQICQMDIGKGELVQIVTGDQNIAEGDIVTHINDVEIQSSIVALDIIDSSAPGDVLRLTVYKAETGATVTVNATMLNDAGSSSYTEIASNNTSSGSGGTFDFPFGE